MGSTGWLWLVLGCVPAESEGLSLDWRWPAAGDALPAHNSLLWVGLLGDAGSLEWRLDGHVLEGEEELREDGRVFHLAAPIPEGAHTLEVAVGATVARWEGTVAANLPPILTLEAGSWRDGEPVELRLGVEDGDDRTEGLSLSGTGEGAALLPAQPPADGRLVWSIWPSEAGSLEVTVTDSLGAVARATVGWERLDEDLDDDGWPTAVDCDDDDAQVYPGQAEGCDGVDQDCDGEVDELALDAGLWFVDEDGDLFGDAEQAFLSCDGGGAVALGQDCDDGQAGSFPGGTELCDGLDNDCDGALDEENPTELLPWYRDDDGDGFGDPADVVSACAAPPGRVADATDCNDQDRSAFPGAPEFCDGDDDDCDGQRDEADALDATTWYADTDGDGYGGPSSTVACTTPAGFLANNQDCDDTSPDVSPAGTETCDLRDEDCDGQIDEADAIDAPTWYADTDGDGYGGPSSTVACTAPAGFLANNQDCDDTSADVSPAGVEYCDLRDEDCDGLTDEADAIDAPTWYADTDGDGYGGPSSTIACTAPVGFLANNQDCDDTSPDVSPAGTETCDFRDEDCDSLIDEVDAINASTWYADTDQDGYGGSAGVTACVAPAGFLANNQDCDDTSSEVSPAGIETCDLRDEDCDGLIDELGAINEQTWYADTDQDGYGGPTSTTVCTAPAGFLANNDDCDDTSADVSPAALEICINQQDDDCDGQIDACPLSVADAVALSGEVGSLFSQVERGDLDGDGEVEIGVGGEDLLWLLPGDYRQPGSVSAQSPRLRGGTLSSFLLGGDRNGDGLAELWWGSSGTAPGGMVWVLEQPATDGAIDSLASLRLEGQPGEEFGSSVAQIDYDLDGVREILVGAPGGAGPGVVYAWNMAGSGVLSSANADAVLSGALVSDRAGGGALGAADLDQDGVEELWVGTPGAGAGAGGVAVVEGWDGLPRDLATATVVWTGASGEAAGSVVEAADLDLDGYPDLLVGSAAGGRLYVLAGPNFSSGLLEDRGARVEGGGGLGASVAAFGLHHGSPLWGVAAPAADVDGAGSGALYLFVGRPEGVHTDADASWVLAGAGGGAGLGGSLAAAGDGDGDGQPDLAVGATGGGIWLYGSRDVE